MLCVYHTYYYYLYIAQFNKVDRVTKTIFNIATMDILRQKLIL
jgi:hypothetical protein